MTRPFEHLLGQKISTIRGVRRGSSQSIEALEVETKHGRVLNFRAEDNGAGVKIAAGAVQADADTFVRLDLTEPLSFAFRADQYAVRIEQLHAAIEDQSTISGWAIHFSSGDYLALFGQRDAIGFVINMRPPGWRSAANRQGNVQE